MGCACSRPTASHDGVGKGTVGQPQLQSRRKGSRQLGSRKAATHAAGTAGATPPESPLNDSPGADSARLNSGHHTSSTTATKCSAGKPAKALALAASKHGSETPQQQDKQPAGGPTAADALAAARQPSADGGHADLAAVLANILHMAAASVVLTAAGRPRSGGASPLADAAASLAHDLAQQRQSPELRQEVVVIMDTAQDRRTRDRARADGQFAQLRFYAGAPLLGSGGHLLGTLCVCDTEARQFGAEACTLLANCAAVAAQELQARDDSSAHSPNAHSSGRRHQRLHSGSCTAGSRPISGDTGPGSPLQLPPTRLHQQQLLAQPRHAGRRSSFEAAAASGHSAGFAACMAGSPASSGGGSGGVRHFSTAGTPSLRSRSTGAAASEPPASTSPTESPEDRPQLPACSLRSDTANVECLAMYSGLLTEPAATAGAARRRARPPHAAAAQQPTERPMPLPPLPGTPPGPVASHPRASPFADQLLQRTAPADDDDLEAKIHAVAYAAARLAARAASTGSDGSALPMWRGPAVTPEAMARSASSISDRRCRVSDACRPPQSRRTASLPLLSPQHGCPLTRSRSPSMPASASMSTLAAAASRSRHNCAGASRLNPQPALCTGLAAATSSADLDIADKLYAELALPLVDAGSGSAGACHAAAAAARGAALIDASRAGWRLLYMTEGFSAVTGIPVGTGGAFWQHFELPNAEGPKAAQPWRHYGARILRAASFNMAVAVAEQSPDRPRTFKLSFSPASKRMLDDAAAIVLPTAGLASSCAADAVPYGLYFATLQPATEPSNRGSFDGSGSGGHLNRSGSSGNGSLSMSRSASLRSDVPPSLTPFADVRLGGLLGKGSFGSVYIGWRGDQEIAVKVIHHVGVMGAAAAKELEATLGQRLEHDNIVRTYDYATRTSGPTATLKRASSRFASNGGGSRRGSANDAGGGAGDMAAIANRQHETWILLELCNGGSLQSVNSAGRLRMSAGQKTTKDGAERKEARPRPPDMRKLLACAVEISEAMRYLHSCGMTHGDLTCNNVLLAEDKADPRGFHTKVSDFGLSRSMHAESSLCTNTFGTVTHMPPELLTEGRLSKAADVYSFGVMLWEMYCMQRPWAELRPIQVIMRKASGALELTWPPGTPTLYRQLAQECLCNEPEARPTFSEVAERCSDMSLAAAAGTLAADQAPCADAAAAVAAAAAVSSSNSRQAPCEPPALQAVRCMPRQP